MPVDEFDQVWVVVLVKTRCILSCWFGKSAGSDDHPSLGTVVLEGSNCRVKFLDNGSADSSGVFAFDYDSTSRAIDDFFHENISALVSRLYRLPGILVTEIAKHVFEFEARQIVQYCHLLSI